MRHGARRRAINWYCQQDDSHVRVDVREGSEKTRSVPWSTKVWKSYLSYWGHGELQRWARNGIAEVKLVLLGEALILRVGRSAVSRDKGVHCDVVC